MVTRNEVFKITISYNILHLKTLHFDPGDEHDYIMKNTPSLQLRLPTCAAPGRQSCPLDSYAKYILLFFICRSSPMEERSALELYDISIYKKYIFNQ